MILLVFLMLLFKFGNTNPIVEGEEVGNSINNLIKKVTNNPGTYSFVVYLNIITNIQVGNTTFEAINACGGSMIKSNVVLTAAHCLTANEEDPFEIYVWGGILDIKKDKKKGENIVVLSYIIHEDYPRNTAGVNQNDIALLLLEKPFKSIGKKIKVATLPQSDFSVEKKYGWVVGWGHTACGEPSNTLQKAKLKTVSQSQCQKFYPDLKITDTVICAVSDDGKSGHHYGDSGGPFVVEDKVVGVIAFSRKLVIVDEIGKEFKKCNPRVPAVYIAVSKFIGWINKQLDGNGGSSFDIK